MQLLLLRHGLAEEVAQSGRDSDRALSPEGRQRLSASLPGLIRIGARPDQLWSSPWRRAAETAELLRPLVKAAPALFQPLAQAPDRELLIALQEFERHAGGALMLVGHQPWLGMLARWLMTGERETTQELPVPKGGLLWLSGEPDPGAMRLELFARPTRLIALGAG
jgi:phosphohistidine phosphatase